MNYWSVRIVNNKTFEISHVRVESQTIQESFDIAESSYPNHSAISSSYVKEESHVNTQTV